jgi:hypothetical protein
VSCREIQEIDLLAFLAEPRSAAFVAFREHYPICPECSAEVRTWTELHGLLALGPSGGDDAHPVEELLLRFDENPAELAPSQRRVIERHLAACPSCRDELVALRGFQSSGFEQRAAPEPAAWRGWIAGLGAGVRGLVLHPAFAYALVLVLLYPLVLEQWRGPGHWDPAGDWADPGPVPPATLGEQPFEEKPISPPRLAKAKEALERPDAFEPAAEEEPSPRKRSQEPSLDRFAFEATPPRGTGIRSLRVGAAQAPPSGALEDGMDSAAVRAYADADASDMLTTPTISLEANRLVEIPGAQGRAGVRLQVPVPGTAGPGCWVEVRVVAPGDRREIRERFRLRADQTQVELRLPSGWASEGTHRVELRLIETEHAAPPSLGSSPIPHSLFRFRFRAGPGSGGRLSGEDGVP